MGQAHTKIMLAVTDTVLQQTIRQGLNLYFPDKALTYDSIDAACADAKGLPVILLTDNAGFLGEDMRKKFPHIRVVLIGADSEDTTCFCTPFRLGALMAFLSREMTRSAVQEIQIGSYALIPHEGKLARTTGESDIRLTEKECDILLALHNAGGTVDRRELLDTIWGYAAGVETHTLETHIYRLRQKMEEDPAHPRYILTDGDGYRLAL